MESEIIEKAIKQYGSHNQMLKCIEECNELSRAISRILIELSSGEGATSKESQDNLYEELADVEIMLAQVIKMFDCSDEVQIEMTRKLQRLKERLENDKSK